MGVDVWFALGPCLSVTWKGNDYIQILIIIPNIAREMWWGHMQRKRGSFQPGKGGIEGWDECLS